MESLSSGDIRKAFDTLRAIYESADIDGFASRAARALLSIIPAERCSYSEFYRERKGYRSFIEPAGVLISGELGEALGRYGHENPMLSYYRLTRREEICTFSDFVSRTQLHRLAIYNEYYRHVDVEYQVVVPLSLKTSDTGFALSRHRADFSTRERLILELLQPHLIQAHANAQFLEQSGVEQNSLESALEAKGHGVIVLSDSGTMLLTTRRSQAMLRDYFGIDDRLPDVLARWIRHEVDALSDESRLPSPRQPLVIARDGRELTVSILQKGDKRMLLLEEHSNELDPQALASLGLTPRQSEVLAWVAQGKTNDEIATIAGARPATVAKHLERIYEKLGVESRTAAAIEALGAAERYSLVER